MAAELCAHCRLPLGRLPFRQRLHGEPRTFCCYGCALAFQVGRGVPEQADAAWQLIRLGLGAFLAMNIMVLSLLLYSGSLGDGDAWLRQVVHLLLLALATPTVLILGLPFLRQAWHAARQGQVAVDTLVSLGVGTAYGYSSWATLTGAEHVYFDTATMVLMLFTLGRYLEAAGRARAMRDLEPLLAPERTPVRVQEDQAEHMRPAAQVAAGARVRVLPGERMPVDGVVLEGASSVDESLMTGEAWPVAKTAGSLVLAGSINGAGTLLLATTAAGNGTQWAAIGRAVAESLRCRSPGQQLADRIAGPFVAGVILLAVAALLYWSVRVPFEQALLTALAVLVVACPCALGLATPLATSLGLGLALRRGALVRSGAAFERLASARVVAFDKTGTLTSGAAHLFCSEGLEGVSTEQVLSMSAALERASEHVLAGPVLAAVGRTKGSAPVATDVQAAPGGGISGRLGSERLAIGTEPYLQTLGWQLPETLAARAAVLAAQGCSVSYVAWGDRVKGLLAFVDPLRDEAQEVVEGLRRMGLHTVLLSGDRSEVVAAVAAKLGIESWRGECGPQDKQAALQALRQTRGAVVMVGDGLNDGPVLAAADVGVALGSASDLARQAAEIVLPAGGLGKLPWLFGLSRAVRRTIVGNHCRAWGYNLVALALAASGLLQPVIAAALMAGSSVLVVLSSLRRQRFDWAQQTAIGRTTVPPLPPTAQELSESKYRPMAQR